MNIVQGEGYRLYRGDCLEVMAGLDGPVDAIIADLPYGTTACEWDSVIPLASLWAQFRRLIKPNGAIVLFGSQPFTSALVMSNPKWFRYRWVWDKHNAATGLHSERMPMRVDEEIIVFGRGGLTYNPQMEKALYRKDKSRAIPNGDAFSGNIVTRAYDNGCAKYPKSIIRGFSNADQTGKIHPTQKPVDLLAYLIRTYTNPGETVLDCTMGSGTTIVAAIQEGRQGIGIEIGADYFDISVKRCADASRAARGLPKLLSDDGDYSDMPLFANGHDKQLVNANGHPLGGEEVEELA